MQKSGIFNSVNHDRVYLASDYASYFNSFISNGVFPNPATNLQVLSNSNMTVTVDAGKGWINGYFYLNDDVLILPIEVADGTLKRIDRIVIRMDTVNRSIVAVVKKGVFASTPVAPVLQRDADAYELALADVYVSAGVTTIAGAAITDQRMNTALCGWVNSLIQADTTAIFDQYQAWFAATAAAEQANFTAWFDSVKGQLSGDVATNLAAQITAINGAGGNVEKANQSALVTHLADCSLQVPYAGSTTGPANTYAIASPTVAALAAGMAVCIKINIDSTAASTLNWCGLGAKAIKKANGASVTNLKAGGVYTLRYDGTSFTLQGEGASGTAIASDLLSGKTASTDAGDITGTMVNNGTVTITPGTTDQTLAAGYHSGSGKVVGDEDLVAANILSGVNIFGVAGSLVAGKKYATGTGTTGTNSVLSVTGLSFLPRIVYLKLPNAQYLICTVDTTPFGRDINSGTNKAYTVSASGFTFTTSWVSTAVTWYAWE